MAFVSQSICNTFVSTAYLLIHCLLLFLLFVGALFCYAVLRVLSIVLKLSGFRLGRESWLLYFYCLTDHVL